METTSEVRMFVGVRMEGGVKTVRTFGYARNAQGRIGQVYSIVQNQRTVSQVWTGRIYPSAKAAADDSWAINRNALMEVTP